MSVIVTFMQMPEETQRSALAVLVNAFSGLDTSLHRGEGKTSVSDGQRFALPSKALLCQQDLSVTRKGNGFLMAIQHHPTLRPTETSAAIARPCDPSNVIAAIRNEPACK